MGITHEDMYARLTTAAQIARDLLEGDDKTSDTGKKAASILRDALNSTENELVTLQHEKRKIRRYI